MERTQMKKVIYLTHNTVELLNASRVDFLSVGEVALSNFIEDVPNSVLLLIAKEQEKFNILGANAFIDMKTYEEEIEFELDKNYKGIEIYDLGRYIVIVTNDVDRELLKRLIEMELEDPFINDDILTLLGHVLSTTK